jgi:hydroxymethylpyrimidine/phosphomethylpyrimidine kinase
MTVPIALTIAGSDSGAGAGIQADLKTFHQFGVYGTTVVVAITAQNTLGVRAVHPVPPAIVAAQLAALAEDLPPAALKSGMLATTDLVREVAAAIRRYRWRNYVLDPVIAASSGDALLDLEALTALRAELVPLAMLVTPNLDEARLLTRQEVADPVAMERAGHALLGAGARAALIKGGHLEGQVVTDVLVTPKGVRRFTHPRLTTRATHGTGCTLSAAITAGLARGMDLEHSVEQALDFVTRAIASAPPLGAGHGPLNHWVRAPKAEESPA